MQADLLDVLTRLASASNIRCMRVTPPFDGLDQFDYGLRKALDPYFDWQEFGSLLLQSTPPNTLLFAEGTFELQFALFRIPDEENAVFMIGPWATAERSEKSRSWARRHIGEKGDDAAMYYISPSYLSSLFKQDTGTTLTDFINTQRIQRAANLLSTTEQNISVVAEQVGILDVNYFTKMFKKSMGSTPTQYRRQSRAR